MGNTAFDTWHGEKDGGPRWDDDVLGSDETHVSQIAAEHAGKLGLRIGGLESGLETSKPGQRAWVRERNGPLYYDFHRATLASDPKRVQAHLRTRILAEKMALIQPPDLEAALNDFAEIADPDDIRREYLLWKHSLLIDARIGRWKPSGEAAAERAGLQVRPDDPKDSLALDSALRGSYGSQTRSPQLARVAFAFAHPNGAFRGTTVHPSGDMILGTLPGGGQSTRDDNRKTIIEEAAHSLLMRHLADEAKRYSAWISERTRIEPNRVKHLPAFAQNAGMPQRSDYSGALAHTMANGVFDQPEKRPFDVDAPSDESVAVTSRLFRREPERPAAHFRSFS